MKLGMQHKLMKLGMQYQSSVNAVHFGQACALTWCMEASLKETYIGALSLLDSKTRHIPVPWVFCRLLSSTAAKRDILWHRKDLPLLLEATEASSSSAVCIGLEPAMHLAFFQVITLFGPW
jgi:hypothetical protein